MLRVQCQIPWHNLQLFTLMLHDLRVYILGAKITKNLSFFNFKKLCCNYLPFISPFRALYHWSRVFWVDMHSSYTSVEIYNFALANQVNANTIIIFFTTILCSLKASLKALIGFGRCYIPSTDDLSCSKLKSVCTILMHQLWANSWKYSRTHLIRTLLICHFRLIRRGNLKTLKPLPLTPMLNEPFN